MMGNIILYQNGDHDVQAEKFGKHNKSSGFAIYEKRVCAAYRVARIGFSGQDGFQRAKKECDKRALAAQILAGMSEDKK